LHLQQQKQTLIEEGLIEMQNANYFQALEGKVLSCALLVPVVYTQIRKSE
jgi:hypothetical protein